MADLWVCNLGRVPYGEALALQQRLRNARAAGAIPDTLLLLEHPPVYTRGRRTEAYELPMRAEWYAERGIEIVDVDRGGHVTYHGPGMLMGYTIMAVPATQRFVSTIEDALIGALGEHGIDAGRRAGGATENLTGVWVDERKIASIGLHISRGYAMHGFAINVACDLEPFSWIVPCGLQGVAMTTVLGELGGTCRDPDLMARMRKRVGCAMAHVSGLRQQLVSGQRLEPFLRGYGDLS